MSPYRIDMTSCVADISRPLMGAFQAKQGIVSQPSSHPSQAIVDVPENLRAKIYAVFSKIGTR